MNKAKIFIPAIIAIHTAWAAWVVISLPLAFIFPHYRSIYLALILFTTVAGLMFRPCPLTIWENRLRTNSGAGGSYDDSCVSHYLKQWFNLTLPRAVVQTLIFVLLASSIILIFYK